MITLVTSEIRPAGHTGGWGWIFGQPSPDYLYIDKTKYTINAFASRVSIFDNIDETTQLTFAEPQPPCSAIQFDINGTSCTFTKNSYGAFLTTDIILGEKQTYTVKVIKIVK